VLQRPALYQGKNSAMPKKAEKQRALQHFRFCSFENAGNQVAFSSRKSHLA
jgi:hypothetical protein